MARAERVRIDASADALTTYLAEIGRSPLLSADEEITLAQAIEAGRAAEERLASTTNAIERRELQGDIEAARQARDRFLESNLRLVVSVAKRYRTGLTGIELLDLIQEGNLGLVRAVEKFDWTKGLRFSTYATWWIRQSVQHALLGKFSPIRVPPRIHDAGVTLRTVSARFQAEKGRSPTLAELAERSGIDLAVVEEALAVGDVISLEAPRGEDGTVFGGFVELDDGAGPEETAVNAGVSTELRKAIDRLGGREALILLRRFGFHDGVPWARGEIGALLGVTAERVYQLEKVALCRLRHPAFGLLESDLA